MMIPARHSSYLIPLNSAIAIANTAHYGAVDEFGEPAILRPLRMALLMGTREGQIVALLHDAIGRPSHDPWTLERIRKHFPSDVIIDALEALIRRTIDAEDTSTPEPYLDFVRRVRLNSLAAVVMARRFDDDLARSPPQDRRDECVAGLAILAV